MASNFKPLANHDLVETVIQGHTQQSFETSATRITDHLLDSGFLVRGGMGNHQISHNVSRLLRDMELPQPAKAAFCAALCVRLWGKRTLFMLEYNPQPIFQ